MPQEDTPTPSASEKAAEKHRFFVVIDRYEEYLHSLELTGEPEEVARQYADIMNSSAGLLRASQDFDFVTGLPSLAGTGAVDTAGRMLAEQIRNSTAVPVVKTACEELYGSDIAPYLAELDATPPQGELPSE